MVALFLFKLNKMGLPKFFNNKETTRSRSGKQESRIAKDLKGGTFINSGATFKQNDIFTDFCEVEAKTTKFKSFKLDLEEFKKLEKKCSSTKIPFMVVQFEDSKKKQLAVLNYHDLLYLLEKINQK